MVQLDETSTVLSPDSKHRREGDITNTRLDDRSMVAFAAEYLRGREKTSKAHYGDCVS